ncbi:Hypothetical protein CINCED_3A015517 [Cinara cedri]|uniref:Uncharacterized protein n=1 Tax=Cinara cedri TaxID=506608 RepID=A0A5E4M7N6_9HEMI|nr:Hypothetical protein CINCED_3A015517 [Cinara cedri]
MFGYNNIGQQAVIWIFKIDCANSEHKKNAWTRRGNNSIDKKYLDGFYLFWICTQQGDTEDDYIMPSTNNTHIQMKNYNILKILYLKVPKICIIGILFQYST